MSEIIYILCAVHYPGGGALSRSRIRESRGSAVGVGAAFVSSETQLSHAPPS